MKAATTSAEPADRPPARARTARGSLRRGEVVRKILHITPGFLPFLLVWFPHSDPLTWTAVGTVAGITLCLTVLYIALKPVVGRPGESDFLGAPLAYAATVLGTLALFRDAPELTGVVVTILAFGDGGAYVGGRWLGRRSLPWNRQKTWAGVVAFLVCGVPAASAAYWLETRPASDWPVALLCGGVAALAAALAESIRSRTTDNLRVGLTAAVVAAACHYVLRPLVE